VRPLKMAALLVLCCLLLPVGGCSLFRQPPVVTPPPAAPPKEAPPLAAVPQADLPEFLDDLDRESLVRALRKSLEYFARIPGRTSCRLGRGASPPAT